MGENKFSVIFDLLKADILAGKFADGRPLPSAPALMRRFGVARATAVAALKELVRCGFATSRRGKGTFPSERTIGLILPGIAYSEFFLPVMSGLSRRCQETGYGLLFGDAYSDGCDGVISAAREARRVKVLVLGAEADDAAAIRKFIAQSKPDAFVCGNDKTAARLRQTLARLGRKVPEEIMLAGFDDVQIASVMTPQLTTIRQPCDGIAEAAFAALLERMRNPSLHPREILLPAPLVVRESTHI